MKLPNDVELVAYDEKVFGFMNEPLMSANKAKSNLYNEKTYIILPKEQEYHLLE